MNIREIRTVTVLGANGTMGKNVAAIFASFGNAKVYMISRNIKDSEQAAVAAAASVKADCIRENLVPADYSTLGKCVGESDLVFDSTIENMDIKLSVLQDVSKYLTEGTICCTGTSGLSINRLSEALTESQRLRFFGMHFFNPPYSMSLCEIISTKHTDRDVISEVKDYASGTLLRTVIEVADQAAFLGNRIGFCLINEALQYAEKYKYNGGIDYIDSIMGCFTGRSMAPLVTSDFVGLDVHKAIVDNIYANTNDYSRESFVFPKWTEKLVAEGKLGKKSGEGLYKTVKSGDKKQYHVYDIETAVYRPRINYEFPFASKMVKALRIGNYRKAFDSLVNNRSQEADICVEFLIKYVLYSFVIAKEVSDSVHCADDAMATGFNWCPPLAMIDAFGGAERFVELVRSRIDQSVLSAIDFDALFADVPRSKYDFRRYIKAKK